MNRYRSPFSKGSTQHFSFCLPDLSSPSSFFDEVSPSNTSHTDKYCSEVNFLFLESTGIIHRPKMEARGHVIADPNPFGKHELEPCFAAASTTSESQRSRSSCLREKYFCALQLTLKMFLTPSDWVMKDRHRARNYFTYALSAVQWKQDGTSYVTCTNMEATSQIRLFVHGKHADVAQRRMWDIIRGIATFVALIMLHSLVQAAAMWWRG